MKNEKKVSTKIYFILCVIILILSCAIICIYNNNNTPLNSYKKQSIDILNQYKDGKLTNKESREKIDEISKKIENEYEIRENSKFLSLLEAKINNISYKLLKQELSNTEIEKYIQEIKNI